MKRVLRLPNRPSRNEASESHSEAIQVDEREVQDSARCHFAG